MTYFLYSILKNNVCLLSVHTERLWVIASLNFIGRIKIMHLSPIQKVTSAFTGWKIHPGDEKRFSPKLMYLNLLWTARDNRQTERQPSYSSAVSSSHFFVGKPEHFLNSSCLYVHYVYCTVTDCVNRSWNVKLLHFSATEFNFCFFTLTVHDLTQFVLSPSVARCDVKCGSRWNLKVRE